MADVIYKSPATGDELTLHFADSFHLFLTGKHPTLTAPPEVAKLFSDLFTLNDPSITGRLFALNKAGRTPFNFFALRDNTDELGTVAVSFCPDNRKQTYDQHGDWSRTGRQVMKEGKWLRSFFQGDTLKAYFITNAVLESFTNCVQLAAGEAPGKKDAGRVIEVTGIDIGRWYSYDVYQEPPSGRRDGYPHGDSELWQSCFAYFGTADTAIPAKLTSHIKCPDLSLLVALNQNGLVTARALVWRSERTPVQYTDAAGNAVWALEDVKKIDRVYALNSDERRRIFAHAAATGIYHDSADVYSYGSSVRHPVHGTSATLYMKCRAGVDAIPVGFKYWDNLAYNRSKVGDKMEYVISNYTGGYYYGSNKDFDEWYDYALKQVPAELRDAPPVKHWSETPRVVPIRRQAGTVEEAREAAVPGAPTPATQAPQGTPATAPVAPGAPHVAPGAPHVVPAYTDTTQSVPVEA